MLSTGTPCPRLPEQPREVEGVVELDGVHGPGRSHDQVPHRLTRERDAEAGRSRQVAIAGE